MNFLKYKTRLPFQICNFWFAFLGITFLIISCNSEVKTSNQTSVNQDTIADEKLKLVNPKIDSIVNYLIAASAKDFYEHQPPLPIKFRNIELRNLKGPNAEDNYLICGSFLTKENEATDTWTSFATIKTSDFEQWIGSSSESFIHDSKRVDYTTTDLTKALDQRLQLLIKH